MPLPIREKFLLLFRDVVQSENNILGHLAGDSWREDHDSVADAAGNTRGGEPGSFVELFGAELGKDGDLPAGVTGGGAFEGDAAMIVELDAY